MLGGVRSGLERVGVVLCSILALQSVLAPAVPTRVTGPWSVVMAASYRAGEAGLYAYAPSAISAGGSTYYFTCHNTVPGVIRDSVWMAEVRDDRVVREQAVLAPSQAGWDSHHVCDPSVVAGRFGFAGRTFGYAMFYLGTPADNTDNQIGVAFADDLAGPWTRSPAPLIAIPDSAAPLWGVGEPSAVTLNASTGSVELFYTDGTAGTAPYRRHLVLGTTGWQIGDPVPVTEAGLGGDVLRNFDVAYDVRRDEFYLAREAGPYPTAAPANISSIVEVDSMPAAALWSGTGAWQVEGRITPAVTSLARNHNPGILRTLDGNLPDDGDLAIIVTGAAMGAFPAVLSSYDLWTVTRRLPDVSEAPRRNPRDRGAPSLGDWVRVAADVDPVPADPA